MAGRGTRAPAGRPGPTVPRAGRGRAGAAPAGADRPAARAASSTSTPPRRRHELAEAIQSDAVEPRYDTAVSIAELVRFPDLDAAVHAVDRLLAPGGTLLAVEPVARPGLVEVVADTAWALHPSVVGFHLSRDLPATLRTTTLVMDDLERFTMPTPIAPLHHFVALAARRARPAGPAAGSDGR